MSSIYILGYIFSFVWFGLTKVSQTTEGRNIWIDPRKYPRKYPKYHVRQWASVINTFYLDSATFWSVTSIHVCETNGSVLDPTGNYIGHLYQRS